jgi:hypothetical protein
MRRAIRAAAALMALASLLVGCGPTPEAPSRGTAPRERGMERGTYRSRTDGNDGWQVQPQLRTQRSSEATRAEFLNRIRSADPQYQTIQKAVLNERNELGIVLNRSVDMDQIPALMKSLLAQMAREFPGEDLTVVAYAPTDPPMKIGTGQLDARTREMTYTAARR